MNKALSFVGLLFIALVGLNWAFIELQAFASSHPLLSYSPFPAYAQEIKSSKSWTKSATVPITVPPVVFQAHLIQATSSKSTTIPNVPFFSQFADIQSPEWQQVGCGITSLAMMIDFYKPDTVSVNTLLRQGVAAGAYDQSDGWTFGGLIQLAQQYGLIGSYHDLSKLSAKNALAQFQSFLKNGPLILSVHNKFNPKNTLPHLVVIDGIKNNVVYYNDPAAKTGKKKISIANLLKGWKEKLIVIRPAKQGAGGTLSLK